MARPVEPVPRFRDEVLKDFAAPSTTCVAGADLLLEELEESDPDPDERCGLLADRFEVYAIPLPRCAHLALAVSLDVSGGEPWPCVVHGLVSRRGRPCEAARRRAERHLGTVGASWEPADG